MSWFGSVPRVCVLVSWLGSVPLCVGELARLNGFALVS